MIVYAEFNDGTWEDVTPEIEFLIIDGSGSFELVGDNAIKVLPGAQPICKPAISAT